MGDRVGSFPDSGRFKGVFRGGAESEQVFEVIGLEEVADFLVRFFLIFSQFIHLTKNEDWGAIFLAVLPKLPVMPMTFRWNNLRNTIR